MASVQPPQALEQRPENRRRSPGVPPGVIPAGPLRPERSESFYEDLDVPPPPAVVPAPSAPSSD
jgi:hypothetical protein